MTARIVALHASTASGAPLAVLDRAELLEEQGSSAKV